MSSVMQAHYALRYNGLQMIIWVGQRRQLRGDWLLLWLVFTAEKVVGELSVDGNFAEQSWLSW